jgi:hypothetical protein
MPGKAPLKRLLLPALVAGAAACSSSSASDAGAGLRWYRTCGAPVCMVAEDGGTGADGGAAGDGGVPGCVTETAGAECATAGATCDPHVGCEVLLRCTDKDPRVQPGGCPISRRAAKRDIAYLDDAERARLVDEVKRMRLATYRYKDAPSKQRLGFIIDDVPGSAAVDGPRDQIDLYGYLSMTVAALQEQMARADAQEREIAALRKRLDAIAASAKRRGRP